MPPYDIFRISVFEKSSISSLQAKSSPMKSTVDRISDILVKRITQSTYRKYIWELYLVTLSILLSMYVAYPLPAFGGLMDS